MTTEVHIARMGLSVPCSVPVVPETGDTLAPMQQRTEQCNRDAWWWFGAAPTCWVHLQVALAIIEDTPAAFLADWRAQHPEWSDVPNETELQSWADGRRYPQNQGIGKPRAKGGLRNEQGILM